MQINKRAVSASTSTAPHVRSLRKPNTDQVSIAIDMDPSSSTRLEDDDDDKGKSCPFLQTFCLTVILLFVIMLLSMLVLRREHNTVFEESP